MAFESVRFAILAFASVALLRLCPRGWTRELLLCTLNFAFLASFVNTPLNVLPLAAFIVLGYGATIVAGSSGRLALSIVVLGVVAVFAWLKQYSAISALPALPFAYTVVGLSYILFRVLHLVIDVAQGVTRRPKFIDYLNYTLFFLTLLAGPIQRYQDFHSQLKRPVFAATLNELSTGLGRALRGYFLLLVLNYFFHSRADEFAVLFYTRFAEGPWPYAAPFLAGAAVLYFLFLFINFVAYMDIVLGLGRLAGLRLPENFDEPYKAVNFFDFWARWHITLSEWLRTYLFNPLLKFMIGRWAKVISVNSLAAIAFFMTFLAIGLWHGTSFQFLVYGLVLGVGATGNKVWQTEATRRLGRQRYRSLCQERWYAYLSRAMTLAYMAMAICVWIIPRPVALGLKPVSQPLSSLHGLVCGSAALLILLATFWLAGPVVQMFAGLAQRCTTATVRGLGRLLPCPAAKPFGALAWTGTKVFAVGILAMVSHWAPEIVYKGF